MNADPKSGTRSSSFAGPPASPIRKARTVRRQASRACVVARHFATVFTRTMARHGEFLHDPFAGNGALERWFGDFSSSRFQPRIDVVDEGPVLRVTAELPGMEREDLKVSVEDGAIVLRGEKRQDVRSEENGCYRLERAHGSFVRTIPMPDNADPEHTLAKFDNGVLTLTVPKSEPAIPTSRTIDIG